MHCHRNSKFVTVILRKLVGRRARFKEIYRDKNDEEIDDATLNQVWISEGYLRQEHEAEDALRAAEIELNNERRIKRHMRS